MLKFLCITSLRSKGIVRPARPALRDPPLRAGGISKKQVLRYENKFALENQSLPMCASSDDTDTVNEPSRLLKREMKAKNAE